MLLLVSLGLSLPFLIIIAFRPVLRKLALRDSFRRPREMALVVLGSMLGTAMLTRPAGGGSGRIHGGCTGPTHE
ncbi:MAG: hypothetical protein HYZ59_07330 [Actinobacteria bacterium]|nr:hypothetical protein [Actinomycetota bacterium]